MKLCLDELNRSTAMPFAFRVYATYEVDSALSDKKLYSILGKAYFLELMMSTEGEEHERAECVYIQLMHGLDECSDGDE